MDDVLDFESSAGTMRKPVGKDVCEGLCTLPLILSLRADGAAIRPLLNSCKPDDETVRTLVDHVRSTGSIDAAKAYAARYTNRALGELKRLPKGHARDNLEILLKNCSYARSERLYKSRHNPPCLSPMFGNTARHG
jgi:heptaprenyl diphosphate synthase